MNGQGESRWGVTVAGRAEGKVKVTESRIKARPVPARPGEQSESRRSRAFHAAEDGPP